MLQCIKRSCAIKRVISKEEGEQLGRKYGINYFEASAFKNIGIEDTFEEILE